MAGRNLLLEEWKECRAAIDRFDKLLVDLRKVGFGFITALVSAIGILAGVVADTKAPSVEPGVKVLIFAIVALLVVSLYLIDRVHQVWLGETVGRAEKLEKRLGLELTRKISAKLKGYETGYIGVFVYLALLTATFAIFMIVLATPSTSYVNWSTWTGHERFAVATFLIAAALIVGIKSRWN